ncbi:protein MAIN-LIKE 2-like [Vicia villosa]|uniref:protein MAIN-LIKE 2-like n=1 Tax=Vicia villosa TaxID=3911 RepID=UPI00273BF667|nr:protein MAIN-LIKE 2-like [Vicia villosa]
MSRLSRASSSREVTQEEEVPKHGEVPKEEVHPEHDDVAQEDTEWFNDVVAGSELGGLCCTIYVTISHAKQGAFAERWNKETPSFHFSVGELTITLYDVVCLLHLPIRGRLYDHSRIQRVEAIEWMVDYLGMNPYMADYECKIANEAHVKFSTLEELYEHHLVAAAGAEDEGDAVFVEYHRDCALRCWLMFLVSTSLFVDKSATYVDLTYLRYFMNLSTVDE